MKNRAYIIIGLMLTCITLYANDTELEVRPANEDLIESQPNQNVTTVIHVTNYSDKRLEFISDVELPEKWKLITREFPYELDMNQSEMKLFSFFIPQSTPTGQYEVIYRVRSRKYPSISGYYEFNVHVHELRDYQLTLSNTPEIVIAGDLIELDILVENKSNVADSLCIRYKTSDDFNIVMNVSSFVLDAGAAQQVLVKIQTDKDLSRDLNAYFLFNLFSKTCQEMVTSTRFSTRIISRVQGSDDPYHRLPVTATASMVTQKINGESGSGFQGDLFGIGHFDQARKHAFQFHLRGPDAYQKALSVYAERDEYVAQYSNPRFRVAIGDRPFTLSTLTQNSSYGRGAEFGVKLTPKWFAGIYHQKNRWFISNSRSTAGYLKYQFNHNLTIQANYIGLNYRDRSGHIMSLTGKTNWRKNKMQVELASSQNGGKAQYGVDAGVSGSYRIALYSMRWIYADSDFSGYYQDTDYLSTSLTLYPVQQLGLRMIYRSEKQNFEMDTTRFSAPLSKYFQTGFIYRLNSGSQVTFDFVTQSRKDRLNSLFSYQERSFRLRMYHTLGMINLSASAEGGVTKNNIYQRDATQRRYTTSIYYRPNNEQSYRGFFYWDENNRYSNEKQRVYTAGLQAKYRPWPRFQISLNLQNNYSLEDFYYDRNQSELFMKYIFKNRHTIQLRGRRTLLKNSFKQTDMAFVAEYKAPFGIPVSRKPNTCIVKGRIYDAETSQPVPDLIVRINGSTAVTNKKGDFLFRNLKKKTYYLTIDKGTMGLNRVTTQRLPIELTTIEGNQGLFVEIGIVDGATLSGRVLLQSIPKSNGTDEEGFVVGSGSATSIDSALCEEGDYGLANIIVEMRRGDEVLRRLTDESGRYEFEELRPGKWIVKFFKNNLPAYHQFEQDTYEIEVNPGDHIILNACAVPQKRRIRFLQGSGQTLYEKFQLNFSPR